MTEPGTILQLASVLGAVGNANESLINLTARLPFQPATTHALVGRAIALQLVERDHNGALILSDRGRSFLREGEAHARPFLASPTGARKPVADSLRQRAWAAMRLSGRFTVGSLVILAGRSGERTPDDNLRRYIRGLMRAGYVCRLPQRQSGPLTGAAAAHQYRLIRDTGPVAPVMRHRCKLLFDPNLGQHVAMPIAAQGGRDEA
jgi:hypothetical protein